MPYARSHPNPINHKMRIKSRGQFAMLSVCPDTAGRYTTVEAEAKSGEDNKGKIDRRHEPVPTKTTRESAPKGSVQTFKVHG